MHSKMYFCFFAQKHTFQMPRRLRQWDVDDIDDILMLFSHCADGIDISAHHRWDVDGCHGPRKLKLFGCVCACGSKLEVFSRTCILCVYIFVHINTMFLPVSVIILTVSSELLMSSILRHSLSVRYRSLFFSSTMTPWVGMIMDTSWLLICVRLIPQCFLHISILTFNWDLNNRSRTIEIWISTVSMQTIDFDLSMTQQFVPFPVILLILTWYWDFAAFRGITL